MGGDAVELAYGAPVPSCETQTSADGRTIGGDGCINNRLDLLGVRHDACSGQHVAKNIHTVNIEGAIFNAEPQLHPIQQDENDANVLQVVRYCVGVDYDVVKVRISQKKGLLGSGPSSYGPSPENGVGRMASPLRIRFPNWSRMWCDLCRAPPF